MKTMKFFNSFLEFFGIRISIEVQLIDSCHML